MAGVSTKFPFNSLLSSSSSSKISPFPLSSSDSSTFGFRLRHSNSLRLLFSFPLPSSSSVSSTNSIFSRYGGPPPRSPNTKRSDEDVELDISAIRSINVRLIDEQQNMVGVVPKAQAIQMAQDADLDLVVLSPDADPPVLRIMDYNKYRFELQKKKKGQQKKSAAARMDLKELKMGYNIDEHDYTVRLKAARKFLNDGDKVKVIVNLKGRENEFRNIAIELIKRFQADVGELASEEAKNLRDRNMFIVLVPNKALLQKAQEPPKKKEKPAVNEISAGV